MLDDNQIRVERKVNDMIANGIEASVDDFNPTFKSGNFVDADNKIDVPYKDLRWSVFKEFEPKRMFDNHKNNVFPFIKTLHGSKETAFANFMKDAQFAVSNPYILDNLAFSFQAQVLANEYYPGLTRKIYLKAYRYNMHLCPKSMLVEVGAQTNTLEEAMNAMEPLADIIDKVIKKDK